MPSAFNILLFNKICWSRPFETVYLTQYSNLAQTFNFIAHSLEVNLRNWKSLCVIASKERNLTPKFGTLTLPHNMDQLRQKGTQKRTPSSFFCSVSNNLAKYTVNTANNMLFFCKQANPNIVSLPVLNRV